MFVCDAGSGVCVVPDRAWVIVSTNDGSLQVLDMTDGHVVRVIGRRGSGELEFQYSVGGLCTTDYGTVLVAESLNSRVQEVNVVTATFVRFVGVGVVDGPDFVDADGTCIAVSETDAHRVSVLSRFDGSLIHRFGGPHGVRLGLELGLPRGVALLGSGSGVAVCDGFHRRVTLYSWTGEVQESMPLPVGWPRNIVETAAGGGGFVVCRGGAGSTAPNDSLHHVVHGACSASGLDTGEVYAAALVPGGGLVARAARSVHVREGQRRLYGVAAAVWVD